MKSSSKSKKMMPDHIVSLVYKVEESKRNQLIDFLKRAVPFYERPGQIQVSLYESLDTPGLYLELIEYEDALAYAADQERVDNSPEYQPVLSEWRGLIAGQPEVRRMKRIYLDE